MPIAVPSMRSRTAQPVTRRRARPDIAVVIGTRPEAIKLAPVILALQARSDLQVTVISTGQHREMLRQVLHTFGLHPTIDLDLMQPKQSLGDVTCAVIAGMKPVFERLEPDMVLVQGDTTTAFAAALSAFYNKVPVAHVEAGLRSHDACNPFPEEMNRRLIAPLAHVHFAPTARSREALLKEHVPASRVLVTGNTVVDALSFLGPLAAECPGPFEQLGLGGSRVVLVTSHRRESWGEDLREICLALKDLVASFSDIHVVFPVHLNPNVRTTVHEMLAGAGRIHLTEPLDYLSFVAAMRHSHLILTDSGGVQEEAPTFGKPVLVLRTLTERPEACDAGMARIVGTSRTRIVTEAGRLLADDAAYARMALGINPFGDGRASDRIAESLCRWGRGEPVLLPEALQFDPSRGVLSSECA